MSLICTQADSDHLAGQVACPACSMMRRIADAIDDVLEWRGQADAGDYPFDWPEQDYELIARSVSEAIGLPALLDVVEAAQLKRNVILHDESMLGGRWVAVPEEDFDALRVALGKIPQCYDKEGE